MPSSPSYLDPVILPLLRGESVLDVACGLGRWAALIRANHWEAGLMTPPVVDGFDAWEPVVERCRESGLYRRVWQQELPSRIEGEWDTVLAAEIIEHVHQDQVTDVLAELERVARKRIILTTPNWPYLRPGHETALGFSKYEAHHSYVPRSLFRRRGYALRGAGMASNPVSVIARASRRLHLADALESLPRLIPSAADQLVAFKDLG